MRRGQVASSSHLLCVDELQRAQRRLEVGGVGLEVVKSGGNLRLQLRGVLAGRAVGRDLVESGGRHLDCWIPWKELTRSFGEAGRKDGWSRGKRRALAARNSQENEVCGSHPARNFSGLMSQLPAGGECCTAGSQLACKTDYTVTSILWKTACWLQCCMGTADVGCLTCVFPLINLDQALLSVCLYCLTSICMGIL